MHGAEFMLILTLGKQLQTVWMHIQYIEKFCGDKRLAHLNVSLATIGGMTMIIMKWTVFVENGVQ